MTIKLPSFSVSYLTSAHEEVPTVGPSSSKHKSFLSSSNIAYIFRHQYVNPSKPAPSLISTPSTNPLAQHHGKSHIDALDLICTFNLLTLKPSRPFLFIHQHEYPPRHRGFQKSYHLIGVFQPRPIMFLSRPRDRILQYVNIQRSTQSY